MTPLPLPLADAMGRLRSRRSFDSGQALSENTVARILELAAQVPSWNDLQPWRFLIIREMRNRQRLRACVFDRQEVVEAPVAVIVLAYLHPHQTHLEPLLQQKLTLGQITPDEAAKTRVTARRRLERIGGFSTWTMHATIRAETGILIAAEALGVQAAPIEEFDATKLAENFGIPDDHIPCGVVALGYSSSVEPSPPRLLPRDICYQEHFGQPWNTEGP